MIIFKSLRIKITLLTIIPLIIIFLLSGIILFYSLEKGAQEVVRQRDAELARIISTRLSESISIFSDELYKIATPFILKKTGIKKLNKVINNNNYLTNLFDTGFVIYNKSLEISYSYNLKKINAKKLPVTQYLEQAKYNLKPMYSNIFKNPVSGNNEIILLVPLKNSGNGFSGLIIGIFSIKYSLMDSVFAKVLEIKSGGSGFSYLLDENNIVIYHRNRSFIGKKLSNNTSLKKLTGNNSGAVFLKNQINENVISGFSPVQGTPWKVITEEIWEIIFKPINSIIYYYFGILVIGFIMLSIILYIGFTKTVINPIENLSDISKKIADTGDYSITVEQSGNDEISSLYIGYSKMLKQIHSREKERDLANNDLSIAKSFLDNVINSMTSILISTDQNGIITQWNKAAEEITGIEASKAIDNALWDISPTFKEYKKLIIKIIASKKRKEFNRVSFNGDKKLYTITFFPLEKTHGIVIRIDDTTELERKEMELRQAQKMESIGTLAGGLAHDFNNVLSGISGTISLIDFILNEKKIIEMDQLRKYIDIMIDAGSRAENMVQQLLSFARKQDLSFVTVNLNSTVNHVISLCENSFDKCIKLNPEYNSNPVLVNADITQIEQVLLNFCVNASHAMTIMREDDEKQGGELTISFEEVTPDKHFIKNHPEAKEIKYWKTNITDTGIGIDKKTATKIFDPFFTTKSMEKGTGLGLAVAYNIIKEHNGFIDLYSEPGIGSTFSIYLPFSSSNKANNKIKDTDIIYSGEGLILIIDDQKIVRNIAKSILEANGYEVIEAVDGAEGLKIFKQKYSEIKAVLLDMIMPNIPGKECYIGLKKIDPEVKVILATGFKKDKRAEEIINLGVNAFLQKPYTVKKLTKILHEVIRE